MQEKTMYGSGEVTLRFMDKMEAQSRLEDATTVHCFPIQDGKVMFTVNPRGIDIIGGHVEPGENYVEALMRESMEEESIVPVKYELIGAIEVDNTNNPAALAKGYPLKGCQLFFAVTEFETKPFQATHECTDRMFLEPAQVETMHHKWLKIHQHLLNEAINEPKSNPKPKF